jgi:O-antigen/teichoic acid export membrane protein
MIGSKLAALLEDRDARYIVFQGGLSLALKVLAGVSGFLLNLVVSRILGAAGAGVFFIGLTLTSVLGILIQLGCDQAVTRRVGVYSLRRDYVAIASTRRSAFVLLGVGGLAGACVVVGMALTGWIAGDESITWVVMCLAALPFASSWLMAHFFLGIGKVAHYQLFQNLLVALLFVVGFWMWSRFTSGASALSAAVCYLFASLLAAVTAEIMWWRALPAVRATADNIVLLAGEAMPLFGIASLGLVMTWASQLVLALHASPADVAVFTVALRTATLVSVVLTAGNSILLPRFAALHSEGNIAGLRRLSVLSTRLMLLVCAPAVICLFLFPSRIMSIFGAEFSAGGGVLAILAAGQLVNVATGAVGGLLNMTGNAGSALKANLVASGFMLAATFLMVPEFGLRGAAIAQASGLVLQMGLMSLYARRKLGFMPASIF